jgi:DNA-binding transcriptional LysR family regulator
MDFDQLHTFLEIVRLKSFSKAAQTCYRTQPAISAQVRQLEQELNTALFERFGSRISLTTAGKIFADYAAQMLDQRRQAQDAINELERNPRGELVIAANEATCIYVLPQVFSEYKNQFPAVQLQVDRSYGARVVDAVMENIADFGLTQLPVEEKRLQVVDIYKDEIRLIAPARHPLADRKAVTRPICSSSNCCCPNPEHARAAQRLVRAGGGRPARLHGTGFHRDDEALRDGRSGPIVPGGFQLPRGSGRRQAARHFAGARADDAAVGADLPEDKALSKAALGFIQVVLDNLGRSARRATSVRRLWWDEMNCRRCGKQFDAAEDLTCPYCGAAHAAAKSGVMKSSTILISMGETDAVYRSVKEVPAPLRRKLLKSTNGLNSATILIADRRGREEIARAIQNLPSSLQRRFLKPFREEPDGPCARGCCGRR